MHEDPCISHMLSDKLALVALLDGRPIGDQEVVDSAPPPPPPPPPNWVSSILSWRFDYEIFYTVILSLQLIQEGQLSVSGKRMCTILVNPLED